MTQCPWSNDSLNFIAHSIRGDRDEIDFSGGAIGTQFDQLDRQQSVLARIQECDPSVGWIARQICDQL